MTIDEVRLTRIFDDAVLSGHYGIAVAALDRLNAIIGLEEDPPKWSDKHP